MPKRVTRSTTSWPYVLLSDRELPPEQQSRFILRPLTQAEKLAVLDGLNWVQQETDGSKKVHPRSFAQALELVMTHLEATENFPSDGPQPWPTTGPALEGKRATYLEMLDEFDILELGNALRYQAQPTIPRALAEGTVPAPGQEVTTVPN